MADELQALLHACAIEGCSQVLSRDDRKASSTQASRHTQSKKNDQKASTQASKRHVSSAPTISLGQGPHLPVRDLELPFTTDLFAMRNTDGLLTLMADELQALLHGCAIEGRLQVLSRDDNRLHGARARQISAQFHIWEPTHSPALSLILVFMMPFAASGFSTS